MSNMEVYSAPSSDVESPDSLPSEIFFSVSIRKFIIMQLLTLGLYFTYWFYRNWKIIQLRTKEDISPIWRTIFIVFNIHDLFKTIHSYATEKEIIPEWDGSKAATIIVLIMVISSIAGQISQRVISDGALMLAVLVPATFSSLFFTLFYSAKVQNTINLINNEENMGNNSKITGYNMVFIVFGLGLWFSSLLGIYVIYSGL